jgi:hypothetical protein
VRRRGSRESSDCIALLDGAVPQCERFDEPSTATSDKQIFGDVYVGRCGCRALPDLLREWMGRQLKPDQTALGPPRVSLESLVGGAREPSRSTGCRAQRGQPSTCEEATAHLHIQSGTVYSKGSRLASSHACSVQPKLSAARTSDPYETMSCAPSCLAKPMATATR